MNLIKAELRTIEGEEVYSITSLEIAEQTGKDHGKVIRDIRKMLEGLEIDEAKFGSVYLGANNQQRPMFILPEREAMILASGYDVKLRSIIVDAFLNKAVKQLTDDEKMAEALQIAMKRVEKQKELLAIQAPKVRFADDVSAKADSIQVGIYCKILEDAYNVHMGENKLRAFFRYKGFLLSGRDPAEKNRPSRKYLDRGWFEEKYVPTARGQVLVTHITGAGQVELESLIMDEFEDWLATCNWKMY